MKHSQHRPWVLAVVSLSVGQIVTPVEARGWRGLNKLFGEGRGAALYVLYPDDISFDCEIGSFDSLDRAKFSPRSQNSCRSKYPKSDGTQPALGQALAQLHVALAVLATVDSSEFVYFPSRIPLPSTPS